MVYQIYYVSKENNGAEYILFDIDYFLTESGKTKKWHSEIHCLPMVRGLVYFLKDAFQDKNFLYDGFVKEAYELQEIRGLLYGSYDNSPKPHKEADQFHYDVFGKALKEKIYDFADKYGLSVNRD